MRSSRESSKRKLQFLSHLRSVLIERFSEAELRNLCFELGVDYDVLPGPSKAEKARELVSYHDRRARISELVDQVLRLRPDIQLDWNGQEPTSTDDREDTSASIRSESGIRRVFCQRCSVWALSRSEALLSECSNCRASIVTCSRPNERAIPDNIVSFSTRQRDVESAVLNWLTSRDFTPADVITHSRRAKISPAYIPLYLFEVDVWGCWTADKKEQSSDSAGREAGGTVKDDLVVSACASKRNLTEEEINFLEGGKRLRVERFQGVYLESCVLEPFMIRAEGIYQYRVKSKIERIARTQAIENSRDAIENFEWDFPLKIELHQVRKLFLPYWFADFLYENRAYRVIVDGQDYSRVCGDFPEDKGVKREIQSRSNTVDLKIYILVFVTTLLTIIMGAVGEWDVLIWGIAILMLMLSAVLFYALGISWKSKIRQNCVSELRAQKDNVLETWISENRSFFA